MAKGRKTQAQVADNDAQPEFENTVLCNVARVARTNAAGVWLKSARGSLLMDVLCFPITQTVKVTAKSKTDPAAFRISLDGAEMTVAEAKEFAIGTACLRDTTTGLQYVTKDAAGVDTMLADVKTTILNRCKRRSSIKRLEIVCKLLVSVAKTQGVGDVFTEDERVQVYNTVAGKLLELKDAIYKVAKKGDKPKSYLQLA